MVYLLYMRAFYIHKANKCKIPAESSVQDFFEAIQRQRHCKVDGLDIAPYTALGVVPAIVGEPLAQNFSCSHVTPSILRTHIDVIEKIDLEPLIFWLHPILRQAHKRSF